MSYDKLASAESVTKTVAALKNNGFNPIVVSTKEEALAKIKELIPAGASVMNGSSQTLSQIGFVDYLKAGQHGWKNLHEAVLKETDEGKKAELRKQSSLSDFYLGSAHALSEGGELVIASASGSQLPHLVFTSQNIILVVGSQKIAPTLEESIKRLREYVFPLENNRMKEVGMGGSIMAKILILEKEPAFMGRSFNIILVNESLGF
ncbi:MAG: lactate utilization protein [bacterium]